MRSLSLPPAGRSHTWNERRQMLRLPIPLCLWIPAVLGLLLGGPLSAAGQTALEEGEISRVSPPSAVVARDTPSDRGYSITLEWELPPQDTGPGGPVTGYRIMRARCAEGPYEEIGQASTGATRYDDTNAENGVAYYYKVTTLEEGTAAQATSAVAGPAEAGPQWINTRQWNVFIVLILLLGFNLYYIEHIKAGGKPFIRKIAGLEAVQEAVGRATEMGRPILFVPGIQDMNDIQTIAGLTILGHIARTTAEYDSSLVVPTSRALVMTTARETVREAYISAGRPDSYDENNIYYVTDEQFGYVAGVNGYMVREKPATCFYMGAFFAESLILAETGNSIGAIQVAGTAMPAQLPFFVAACDYTLIGEELFAASAYLSGEPKQLGSIKGQDVGKFLGVLSIVIGVLILSIAAVTGWDSLAHIGDWIRTFWSTELA